ncbi:MAG: glucosaminidase domain-containing protein [Bacteroidota bacterium]
MTPSHRVNSATYQNSRVTTESRFKLEAIPESVLWKIVILAGLLYLVWSDKISIVFGVADNDKPALETGKRAKASLLDFSLSGPTKEKRQMPPVEVTLPPNELNNLTFAIDHAFAERNGISETDVARRMARCNMYVDQFAPVAVAEMRRTNIPASIILAQGLLESDAGKSKLALATNNHFGIKCFSKRCKKGHCKNFTDDSHKDFFVNYANAWGSFRAHSEMLRNQKRYADLFDLKENDYRGWAYGLVKSGYATDKKYAEKLIAIIEALKLYQYDARA